MKKKAATKHYKNTISSANNTEVFFGIYLFCSHGDCLSASLIELYTKAILYNQTSLNNHLECNQKNLYNKMIIFKKVS